MPKPPEPPEPEIHAAARRGDLVALERLVAAGHDINARTDLEVDNGPHLRSLTPLMVAARSIDGASHETLTWLLEHGADLRATSEGGETAAWYAAGKGGRWDFHEWRLADNHVDRLRALLDAGLDPNETTFHGKSLLVEACGAGDPARIQLLFARGVSAKFVPGNERTRSTQKDMMADMLATSGMEGEAAAEMLNMLKPANPGGRDSFAIPLFAAAESGVAECIRLLLAHGADLHERDARGQTALMHAASPAAAEALISAGSDPNARTPRGEDVLSTILGGASCTAGLCGPGRFDVARVLLAHGAILDQSGTRFENTRLYDAAFRHQADTVSFLLSIGRDAAETDARGQTALHAICWQGEYSDPDMNVCCEQIIRALVSSGASVDARDSSGNTPLHEATDGDWGNQTAVRVLLELGAQPDPQNSAGQTPLMDAASRGEIECVRLLLAAGANPDTRNQDGFNARDYARGHLDSWRQINAEGPTDPRLGPADEQRARHQQALRDAEESQNLLRNPPIPPS